MDLISPIILVISVVLFVQGLFALYLMLYAWEYPERLAASRGPREFVRPKESFTVLLPARHEEGVIADTIRGIWRANYPKSLLEIIVICHQDDTATIREARRAIRKLRSPRVRLETFSAGVINKPHALNIAFARSSGRMVTIFDAEDDVHPDLFNVVNTVVQSEGAGIVQGGVQLMNFRDHWFSPHNCLEYFFWFKSRLHFHARVGLIPLGGNTVFIRRDLIERAGGWDDTCLTEDADIGIRLSALGEPIRVVYDPIHVTREETPPTVSALIRQRTRWSQGFIQVLRKGEWTRIHGGGRKLLAAYTFSYPFLQVMLTLLWPLALFGGLFLKLPIPITMIAFLPLYALFFQFVVNAVGAVVFAREFGQRVDPILLGKMAVTFLPYQWVLGFSSLRAVYRELESEIGWEKTQHTGAHRRAGRPVPARSVTLLPRIRASAPALRDGARSVATVTRRLSMAAPGVLLGGVSTGQIAAQRLQSMARGERVVALQGAATRLVAFARERRAAGASVAEPSASVTPRRPAGRLVPLASVSPPGLQVPPSGPALTRGTLVGCRHYLAWASGRSVCSVCRRPVLAAGRVQTDAPTTPPLIAVERGGERSPRVSSSLLVVGAICVLGALIVMGITLDAHELVVEWAHFFTRTLAHPVSPRGGAG